MTTNKEQLIKGVKGFIALIVIVATIMTCSEMWNQVAAGVVEKFYIYPGIVTFVAGLWTGIGLIRRTYK